METPNKSESPQNQLVNTAINKELYGDSYQTHILEQYKTCIEAAGQISAQRNVTNQFLTSIVTAIIGACMLVVNKEGYQTIILACLGLTFCFVWLRLLHTYKLMNKVKFDVINELENMLPVRPFNDEWRRFKTQQFVTFSRIELIVPIVCAVLFVIVGCYGLYISLL